MKNIFVFVVAIVLAQGSYSQIRFGLKGGANLATVRYLNEDNSRARLGVHFGALLEIPLQENLFVRPELLYSSKGFGYSATQSGREGSLRLNYVALPLLLGFRPTTTTAILAGPEIGFLQKAVSRSAGFSNDMTPFYRKFDIAFDLGFAYYVTTNAGVDARYSYGFKNLVNTVITDTGGNVVGQGKRGANRVLQISFFLLL